MYLAGMISGLLGIGSGVFKVPAMDLGMRIPIKGLQRTSNFMIGVTAAASAGVYFVRGDIDPFIAAPWQPAWSWALLQDRGFYLGPTAACFGSCLSWCCS